LSRVIAGDKSWIYGYDPETKQQSSQWKMKSKVKSMLIIFFNIKGIVRKEFTAIHSAFPLHTTVSRVEAG
jgi:hypothetical protein